MTVRTLMGVSIQITALTLALSTSAAAPAFDSQTYAAGALKQLIEMDTTAAHGTRQAAEAIATRLRDAGFSATDVQVLAPADLPSRANVVARLRGAGLAKPLLLIGHLDVVEAPRASWSVDPFKLTQKDGWYYGRGTLDIKGEDVAILTAVVRMKQDGFVPDRDIIVAFTADEEAGTHDGVKWLLKTHRDLLQAAIAINPDEGAAGLRDGKRVYYGVQTSTKRYVTFTITAAGKTGNTAIPQPDNAIYKLAAALTHLAALQFPIELDDTTRTYFGRTAATETGQVRTDMLAISTPTPDLAAANRLATASPERNATLRTTCVASMLRAGEAENALADTATATVQCRLLPADSPQQVQQTIAHGLESDAVMIKMTDPGDPNPASPPTPQIMARVEAAVHAQWPGVLVLPALNIGASDSVYTRAAKIPTYGLCSIWYDLDDDRAHADDERIGVKEFQEGVQFTYTLIKTMSAR